VCSPLGEHFAGFLRRRDAACVSVPDALVDGGESFVVFVIEDGSGIFEIEFVRLRHGVIVGRIFDRCNENRCLWHYRSDPFDFAQGRLFRQERERMGHPAIVRMNPIQQTKSVLENPDQ
jgi:hypothetical protein